MARQNAATAFPRRNRARPGNVIYAIAELADQLHRIHALPQQVAGVEVEIELLAVVEGFQRRTSRVQLEVNLRRMRFQGELYAAFGKRVEKRIEPLGQQLGAFFSPFSSRTFFPLYLSLKLN